MYTGAGSGPMWASAAAWDTLGSELSSAAACYRSVVSGLTDGPWLGPASASMAAAVAPYAAWMRLTAEQATRTANQARSAAAAYEEAFAATVPPPVIAENRALLMSLVATNILGQNTPAIAATETQYAGMWAQDATAMYCYAGASAGPATLTPFTAPPQDTNPGGVDAQAAAVAQAAATSPAAHSPKVLSQLLSAVPGALRALASGVPVGTITGLGTALNGNAGWLNFASGLTFVASGIMYVLPNHIWDSVSALGWSAGTGRLSRGEPCRRRRARRTRGEQSCNLDGPEPS